ncbi:hypothetical protein HNR39_001555 [Glaciimonas immobilis]|uniref:Uncharacterized protein n=1 Tax=Glaciimonas immobilis TaxID=728004 RepID=A0A840RPS5_9BURK|nr:hypothetical protein [Glaciimonas immobilis]
MKRDRRKAARDKIEAGIKPGASQARKKITKATLSANTFEAIARGWARP